MANKIKAFLFGLFVMVLTGCATPHRRTYLEPTDYVPIDEVVIQQKFDGINLNPENLFFEMSRCVPQLSVTSKNSLNIYRDFPTKSLHVLGHKSSGNLFLVKGVSGLCLKQSSEKFPVFAAEAFYETINPKGVPPDVVDTWYRQLAQLIARKGMAKIAYTYTNGNAAIASYWVESNPKSTLFYSSVFKRAGQWESESVDATFAHPSLTSITETKRGKSTEKSYVLDHRK